MYKKNQHIHFVGIGGVGMSGWHILIWCAVCASGVLTFLRLVANDIGLAVEAVRRLEEQERKAQERRMALEEQARVAAE